MSASTPSPAPSGGPLRMGCVPYLNSKVFLWKLAPDGPGHRLELHPPSVLARKLAAGELDLALVSSIEYFRQPRYLILPGLSISSRSEMWSIRLFLRVPLERARRLGLDPASETTNALLQVLLREKYHSDAQTVPLALGEDPLERTDLDGFVQIGDAALALNWPGLAALDLAAEWHAFTHLPFVFALWLTPYGTSLRGMDKTLMHNRSEGLRHAEEIAREFGPALGLDPRRAKEYVSYVVGYSLGPQELGGLDLFRRYLLRLGLIERDRPFEFYRSSAAAGAAGAAPPA